jgi:outer membrane protein OmpA-like peptidoglycan-associated protein
MTEKEQKLGSGKTITDIDLTGKDADIIAQVKEFADVEKLKQYLKAEKSAKTPRETVVKAIEEQLENIVTCKKCKKNFPQSEKGNAPVKGEYVCNDCKRKQKKIGLLIGLGVLILLVAALLLLCSKGLIFSGTGNINDSIDVSTQNATALDLSNETSLSRSIGGIDTISNIESYKRHIEKELSNDSSKIILPSIAILFALNATDLFPKGKELIDYLSAKYLQTNNKADILIYCLDNELSKKQAEAIKLALIKNKIPENKIIIGFKGVGEINDAITMSASDAPTIDIDNATSTGAAVTGVSGTITNIESFKRKIKEENNNNIPSIGVLFEFKKSSLTPEGKAFIDEFATYYLKTDKKAIILIEGYTCSIGSDEVNYALSKLRAEAVKEILIRDNVPESNLELKWYGESRYSQLNYKTIQEHRRVDISIK